MLTTSLRTRSPVSRSDAICSSAIDIIETGTTISRRRRGARSPKKPKAVPFFLNADGRRLRPPRRPIRHRQPRPRTVALQMRD